MKKLLLILIYCLTNYLGANTSVEYLKINTIWNKTDVILLGEYSHHDSIYKVIKTKLINDFTNIDSYRFVLFEENQSFIKDLSLFLAYQDSLVTSDKTLAKPEDSDVETGQYKNTNFLFKKEIIHHWGIDVGFYNTFDQDKIAELKRISKFIEQTEKNSLDYVIYQIEKISSSKTAFNRDDKFRYKTSIYSLIIRSIQTELNISIKGSLKYLVLFNLKLSMEIAKARNKNGELKHNSINHELIVKMRDSIMASNLLWLKENIFQTCKIIVSASNYHIASQISIHCKKEKNNPKNLNDFLQSSNIRTYSIAILPVYENRLSIISDSGKISNLNDGTIFHNRTYSYKVIKCNNSNFIRFPLTPENGSMCQLNLLFDAYIIIE